jgi:phage FluMu gp28-like protein
VNAKELVKNLATPYGLLQALFKLEPYQTAFLQDSATMRVVLKSRQVGFSWLFAAEAVANVCLSPGHQAIFVSLNREEAQEKIRYALEVLEALPPAWRPKLKRCSRSGLEFADGGRILSHPCRAPRGRSGADVYLDEMAFYRGDADVFFGTLPVVSRRGRITIASTPFGRRGVFWLECDRRMAQKGRPVHVVPWWHCSWLCTDTKSAVVSADEMDTPERVQRFGTARLREIFRSMDLDSFQQEYECRFGDAEASWIPYGELLPCVDESLSVENAPYPREASGELFAGYDVGRTQHASELVVLERQGSRFVVRAVVSLHQAEYGVQRQYLCDLMQANNGAVRRLCIDATGIGSYLAEEMAKAFPMRVEPVVFTPRVKESLAVALRIAFQNRDLLIPPDRGLIRQIHSVRRTVTSAGNARFDAESSETEHADKFWALALALHAALPPQRTVTATRVNF